MEYDYIERGDCMMLMQLLPNNSVDFTLTDIPYDEVNRKSNGLRNLDKDKADILTFDLCPADIPLAEFVKENM